MHNNLRSSKSIRDVLEAPSNKSDLSVSAKLRRLRLEENILLKLLHSTASKELQDESKVSMYSSNLDFITYTSKLEISLNELKKIYEDIRCISNDENLKGVDVDDVKKDVMELDTKIRTLKTFLKDELISLRCNQEILEQQMEDSAATAKCIRRRGSCTQINKQFVVSPVKNLMTTPFKCSAVQQFQDFMANSPNRYGGWNEYNHLIFINLWNKFFGENLTESLIEYGVENSYLFPQFIEELLQKVIGPNKDDLIDHAKWYSKYLLVKDCQQKALLKWKSAKNKIRNSNCKSFDKKKPASACNSGTSQVQKFDEEITLENSNSEEIDASSEESEVFIRYLFREDENETEIHKNKSALNKYEKLNYLKPTEQWTSRCTDDNAKIPFTFRSVEEIPKMAIPKWRLDL